jgi:hypothetical protein
MAVVFLIAPSSDEDPSVRFADVSTHEQPAGVPVTKSDGEIMEIFEAYDDSAAQFRAG